MTILYVLLAIVILLFMVLIHELGHYIVGKILKFKITEFSVGFGPAIFSHTSKKTGEKFSLRAFPLGGYCSFYGEEEDSAKSKAFSDRKIWRKEFKDVFGSGEDLAFNDQKPWKRVLVFCAGVAANFLTAIVFSWILLCTIGYDVPQIVSYNDAYLNGYEVGDVITHINGEKIDFAFGGSYVDLVQAERSAAATYYTETYGVNADFDDIAGSGELEYYTFEMTVKRDGESMNLTIKCYPVVETKTNSETNLVENYINTYVGLETDTGEEARTVAYVYSAWEGFCRSFEMAFGFAWVVLKSLWQLVTFQIAITEMGGTVTAISTIATVASQSMSYLLVYIPLIAANLAVFNFLPFPALDGAHVLFTLIEWIRGKPVNREVENMIHFVGICLLFGLVIVLDILHFALT